MKGKGGKFWEDGIKKPEIRARVYPVHSGKSKACDKPETLENLHHKCPYPAFKKREFAG